MANSYFQFKQFIIQQDKCAMKVTTDACLFGAWTGEKVRSQNSKGLNLLDIGAGTGLLSLMLAQKNPTVSIDAIEIDNDTFEQAIENVALSPWAGSIKLIRADAKKFVSPNKYNFIISNPPFYENELKSGKKNKNIAHHSDDLSLKELLAVIKNNLQPTGSFYLLLPYKRHKEIRELMLENDLALTQMLMVRQSVDHDYFRILLAGKLRSAYSDETMIDDMSITDDKAQYTSEFVNLLNEYYLHM